MVHHQFTRVLLQLVCFHQGNYHDFAESFVHGGALLTPTL